MLTSLPLRGELVVTNTLTLDASKVYLLKGFVVVKYGPLESDKHLEHVAQLVPAKSKK